MCFVCNDVDTNVVTNKKEGGDKYGPPPAVRGLRANRFYDDDKEMTRPTAELLHQGGRPFWRTEKVDVFIRR